MKKYLPYLLGLVALVGIFLLLLNNRRTAHRVFNERITLRVRDKIPYGFFAARALLPGLFPGAAITTGKSYPGYWDSLSTDEGGQAVILAGAALKASEDEMNELVQFARAGNYVFIIARDLSAVAAQKLGTGPVSSDHFFNAGGGDSLQEQLVLPRYTDSTVYTYPGKEYAAYFSEPDTTKVQVLGRDKENRPVFVQVKAGAGAFYIHLAPLAFSNYFILHRNNTRYYEQVFSVIPCSIRKLEWNEYYLFKKTEPQEAAPNFLSVLMRYPAFRWALITALAVLLLYTLSETRRRQRRIPVLPERRNASLDFVRTIGQLYYDKRDHANLARKMSTYFLEHIRSRYKLATATPDSQFIQAVSARTGASVAELTPIFNFIHGLENRRVNEAALIQFYEQLEQFYRTTAYGNTGI